MKRRALIALFLSVVMCAAFCIPVFATPLNADYIASCPSYPYSEVLPFGEETVVFNCLDNRGNDTWYFIRKLPSYPVADGDSVQNFTLNPYILYNPGFTSYLEILSASQIIHVYYDSRNTIKTERLGSYSSQLGGWSYTINFSGSGYNSPYCNVPNYALGTGDHTTDEFWSWIVRPYPSINDNLGSQIEQGNSELQSRIQQGNSEVQSQIQQGNSEVQSRLQQGFTELNEAGAEEPTLDSDTSWMDEALDNVNGWIESVDGFADSLETAGEDVSDYIESGSTLFSRFLDLCEDVAPGLYAIIIFVFIWVVVRKIIGR